MTSKIPIILCHTDILSGVTSWGINLRQALEGHERYEPILVNLWKEPSDRFDVNVPSLKKLYEFIDTKSPAIVIPNYTWRILEEYPRLFQSSNLRFLGLCHSDTSEEYYQPLSRHEEKIDKFIAVSPECTKNLSSWIPHRSDDITTLPYGINVPSKLDRQYSTDPIRLVYGGRIVNKQKRVFDYVPLVQHLINLGVNFQFDIVGDGDDCEELQMRFKNEVNSDRVTFLGQITPEKMSQIWTQYDLFIQVSDFEGTSVSMLESMAAGVIPIVTSASSGVSNVISEGENGLIFPIGDMESMAKGIQRLITQPELVKQMGKAAHKNATQYSMANYVNAFTSLLDEIVHNFDSSNHSNKKERGSKLKSEAVNAIAQTAKSTYKQNTSYMICTTPRSGSNWLCDLLDWTQLAGTPREYFYQNDFPLYFKEVGADNFTDYLEKLSAHSGSNNGVFGFKIMPTHFFSADKLIRNTINKYKDASLSTSELINDLYPGIKYIWLTRRNKIRQAISYLKAHQSNIWHATSKTSGSQSPHLSYDYDSLNMLIRSITGQETMWDDYFTEAGIEPLVVVYEDLKQNPEETLMRIFDYLEIEIPKGKNILYEVPSQKLSNSQSEEWYRLYISENDREQTNWWQRFEAYNKEARENTQPSIDVQPETQEKEVNPWKRSHPHPESLCPVPTSLSQDEQLYLYWLSKEEHEGVGEWVMLGCAVGDKNVLIDAGLKENTRKEKPNPIIHVFDNFVYSENLANNFDYRFIRQGESYLADFYQHIAMCKHEVRVYPDDIVEQHWSGVPIEMLLIENSYSSEYINHIIKEFFSALIPGKSILIIQNYYHFENYWIHVVMEFFAEYFDTLHTIDTNGQSFRYKKEIPRDILDSNFETRFSIERQVELTDSAINKQIESLKPYVELSKVKLLLDLNENDQSSELLMSLNKLKEIEDAKLKNYIEICSNLLDENITN